MTCAVQHFVLTTVIIFWCFRFFYCKVSLEENFFTYWFMTSLLTQSRWQIIQIELCKSGAIKLVIPMANVQLLSTRVSIKLNAPIFQYGRKNFFLNYNQPSITYESQILLWFCYAKCFDSRATYVRPSEISRQLSQLYPKLCVHNLCNVIIIIDFGNWFCIFHNSVLFFFFCCIHVTFFTPL